MPIPDEARAGAGDDLRPMVSDGGSAPDGGVLRSESVGSMGQPASHAEVRRAYVYQAAVGYVLYLVGAVTAFLAVSLSLSDAQAGLHSSALAIGGIVAGLTSDRLDRLMSFKIVQIGAIAALLFGCLLLAWAPAFGVTLAGAGVAGLGTGLLLAHLNQTLTAGGGALARVRLSRSTLVATVSSAAVPIAIGMADDSGLGWRFAVAPALVLVGIALVVGFRAEDRQPQVISGGGRLPDLFWIAAAVVGLAVAAEFAIVFWGSSLVEEQTVASLGDATLTISAFVGGIIVGRIGLSLEALGRRDPVWLIRGGLLLALIGPLMLRATSSFEVSAVAMFVSGLGIGVLYPLAASIAIAAAGDKGPVASARIVVVAASAVLVAPLALGVIADLSDISIAWLMIPVFGVVSLALTVPMARARPPDLESGTSAGA